MYFLLCHQKETSRENVSHGKVQVTLGQWPKGWGRFRSWSRKVCLGEKSRVEQGPGLPRTLGQAIATFRCILDANDRKLDPTWLG